MRPRRIPGSHDTVFRLLGGNEDNDLWAHCGTEDGVRFVESVWELNDAERAAIADAGTVELRVYGVGTPPVSLAIGSSLAERRGTDVQR